MLGYYTAPYEVYRLEDSPLICCDTRPLPEDRVYQARMINGRAHHPITGQPWPRGVGLGLTGEELRARARELYDDALRLSRAGQHEEALRIFRQAYQTVQEPEVAHAIAAELYQLRRWAEAEAQFREYLRLAPTGQFVEPARRILRELIERRENAALQQTMREAGRTASAPAPLPVEPPPVPDSLKPSGSSEIDTYVIVGIAGAGIVAIGVAAWALTRKKRVASNRRRRRYS